MKGIVLAAGKGTRLYPITKPVCKPLLPVYDKPMIYYPISSLLLAGIREILVIVPPGDVGVFQDLLGDGSNFGVSISYREQFVQRGIADAFIVGEDFIGGDSVCLALGDNIFYGQGFPDAISQALACKGGAAIFGCYVKDPRPFGVVEFDKNGKAISIEEKPQHPKSNYIVPGMYFYDNRVVEIAKNVEVSARGELEITSVNNAYLSRGELNVIPLGRGFRWFDTGNADSLMEAAYAVMQKQREGVMIGCIEETAYNQGFITKEQLHAIGENLKMTKYGQYLLEV